MKQIALIICLLSLSGCAFAPVETDPAKQAERWQAMKQECYSKGGVWNDDVHGCMAKDMKY